MPIEDLCREFLLTYFGGDNDGTAAGEKGLRLVCLGTEHAVHGELIFFLRSRGVNAVLECATAGRRRIDVLVFTNDWQGAAFAIELKHFSANQGPLTVLMHDLKEDYNRHGDAPGHELPLIQIGLYTEIFKVTPVVTEGPFGLYRFLRAYYRGENEQFDLGNYQDPEYVRYQALVTPAQTQLNINGQLVTGRVRYILTGPA